MNCPVTSSGDAVVPIAAIDDKRAKVEVDEDRMFSVTSPRRYDDDNNYCIVGPEVLSVDGGPLSLSAGGLQSSMSQRNLETILEAIRFLEGDSGSCHGSRLSLTSVCS